MFVDGVEIGNGYYELDDAGEQAERMSADLEGLAALRSALPQSLQQSPLADANSLADAMIEAFMTMLDRTNAAPSNRPKH